MENQSMLDKMHLFLQKEYPALDGTYFSKSTNRFGAHPTYLFDTPHGFWGEPPGKPLPDDHSTRLTGLVQKLITDARTQVDITNLRLPSGEFQQAIIGGIKNNTSTTPLKIRMLCGRGGQELLDAEGFLKTIQTGINNKPVELYVGVQTVTLALEVPIGWNHAKYIAVDGNTILFGGHNYIGKTYLGTNPIFDISMKLDGPLATRAHYFSNELWKFVNKWNTWGHTSYAFALKDLTIERRNAPMFSETYDNSIPDRTVPVVHVTQLGHRLIDDHEKPFANPSLSSIYYAMGEAKTSICIAQQDIGGMGYEAHASTDEGKWDKTTADVPFVTIRDPQFPTKAEMRHFDINLFNSLCGNLKNNAALHVRMVLTNLDARSEAGGDHAAYSNNTSAYCVYRAIGWFLIKRLGCTTAQASAIITNQVKIRTIGFGNLTSWQVGDKHPIGNHAKYWSVDDEICSIGSNNMYPNTIHRGGKVRTGHHQEWAVVIGKNDANVVKNIREDYFEHVYKASVDAVFKENYIWALRDPQNWP